MSILYSPETKIEQRVLTVLVGLSGITLSLILALYFLDPRPIIGDALVNTSSGAPFEIPPASISPFFHVKPVTIFFAALVVFGYSSLSLLKKSIPRMPSYLRTFLLVLSVLALVVCVYEVFFNFVLWTVLMITQTPNPDHAVNNFPGGFLQINLVFATKSFVALLFISYFAVDSLRVTKTAASIDNSRV